MENILITNIGQLLTIGGSKKAKKLNQLKDIGLKKNAWLFLKKGKIAAVGSHNKKFPRQISYIKKLYAINATGRVVMPGMIDCHTHLVFGGNRAEEFSEKAAGTPYLKILKKGGGILSTMAHTRTATEKELISAALQHLKEFLRLGVTTVEVKSGYGLNKESELKILKIIKKLNQLQPIELIPTFLGSHVIPPEFKGKAWQYLEYLIREVLPEARKLANFCDIFCEKDAFTPQQSRKYLMAAKKLGFQIKIHADQLHPYLGATIAGETKAVSADHLDFATTAGLKKMAASGTIAVLLPGVNLFLGQKTFAPARKMIEMGIPIALSTDFNPGSCPSKNLFLMMNLACIHMKLSTEEVINAVTINAAHALKKAHEIGSIEIDKKADVLILGCKDYREIPYWMDRNLIKTVIVSKKNHFKIINRC